jgi:UDP-N-acetylmuramoyl-L-alanyl-D-glutamate--2,6-diaminopimelate ligase
VSGALAALGRRAGHIGTAGNALDGVVEKASFTTPEAPELQGLLRRWVDGGAEAVAMEVSSIGLAQRRVDGCRFHAACFTNLTQDHLDFHGTMEAYRQAKARLFAELLRAPGGAPRAVLCADDPAHEAMSAPSDRWTYGFDPSADWRVDDASLTPEGASLSMSTPMGPLTLHSPMLGRHNAQNLAAAAALLATLGLPLEAVARGLQAVDGVPGRLERVVDPTGERLVVVDYAHSPDALDHALRTVGALLSPGGRLWVVFGCGGDRDKGKRPQMGAVAERSGARVVLTSDNPRSEDPLDILADIRAGMAAPPECTEPDRRAAIRYAIAHAGPGDAVLVAGKGHETTQVVNGVEHPFDDRRVAADALEGR